MTCKGDDVILSYTPAADETLLWSDGTTAPTFAATQSDTYRSNCFDEIQITIKGSDELVIPNVVTDNGDGKNDRFLLPADVENIFATHLKSSDRIKKEDYEKDLGCAK